MSVGRIMPVTDEAEVVNLITPSPEPEPKESLSSTFSPAYALSVAEVQHTQVPHLLKGVLPSRQPHVPRPAPDIPKSASLPVAPRPGLLSFLRVHGQCDEVQHGQKRRLSTPSDTSTESSAKRPKHIQHGPKAPSAETDGPRVYSQKEDVLLHRLRAVERQSWDYIEQHFPSRSRAALQVRFSTKLRHWPVPSHAEQANTPVKPSKTKTNVERPRRDVRRNGGPSALEGIISWKQVDTGLLDEIAAQPIDVDLPKRQQPTFPYDHIAPVSLARHLRLRELGTGRHGMTKVPRELIDHAYAKYRLTKSFSPTCGDVNSLAWSPDLRHQGTPLRFAAASIAISDNRNMQYNGGLNLLVGDHESQTLHELPHHCVDRPVLAADLSNPNTLHDMRNTQDKNLYKTVNAVAFSSCGTRLFSVGDDSTLRSYRFHRENAILEHTIYEPAAVTLLSVNTDDLVATVFRTSERSSIQVHRFQDDSMRREHAITIEDAKLLPAALSWGTTSWRKHFLLAGFTSDGCERGSLTSGATYLCNAERGLAPVKLSHTPNVFQVAWNPIPSSSSPWFCVASAPTLNVSKGTRSVVQCFGLSKTHALRPVYELECPSRDINELTYCQHDPTLIAAGSTDGRVYIWDTRFVRRTQHPLHVLEHGESVQIIDHDVNREEIETGIGFLAWGATSARLYSGSADGVVKVWNPYRAPENVLIGNLATFPTAVMSGKFSPDYRDLLIGEECGRLNLLSLGRGAVQTRSESESFQLRRAPLTCPPEMARGHREAAELLSTGQIELRPMGNMPIRQAVQGPYYQGPYFRPSVDDWTQAQAASDAAQTRIAAAPAEPDTKIEEHKKRLEAAQNLLADYRARESDWEQLRIHAIAQQRTWASQERDDVLSSPRSAVPANIPKDIVTRETDSQQRIPENLRHLPSAPLDVKALSCDQLYALGLALRCIHCERAADAKMRGQNAQSAHYQNLCKAQRVRTLGRWSTSCGRCGAPTQSRPDSDDRALCVRCSFACIRCGGVAELSASTTHLICVSCEMSWTVDVLGYNAEKARSSAGKTRPNSGHASNEEVMDSHLDHLWTLWDS